MSCGWNCRTNGSPNRTNGSLNRKSGWKNRTSGSPNWKNGWKKTNGWSHRYRKRSEIRKIRNSDGIAHTKMQA